MRREQIWWTVIRVAATSLLTACQASRASSPILPTPLAAPALSGQVTVGEAAEIALSGDGETLVSLPPHHTWLEGDVLYTFLWSEDVARPVSIDLPGGQVHDLKDETGQWPGQIGQQRYLVRTQGHPTGEGSSYWDYVHVFDLQSGKETVLGGAGRSLHYPAVSGSIIVWDERNMTHPHLSQHATNYLPRQSNGELPEKSR